MVVSGRIDEVNARIMGDSLLSVEVLGEPEAFLRIVGRGRAGRARSSGRATALRVPVPGRRGGRPASCWRRLVHAGRSRGLVRAAARQPRRAVPQGRVPRSFRDELGLGRATGSTIRSSSSTSGRGCAGSRLVSSIVITLVLCLCIAWGGYQLDAFLNGGAFGALLALQVVILAIMGASQVGSAVGLGAGIGDPRLSPRLAPDAHRADARLLLRRTDPRVPASSPARCRSRSSAWPWARPTSAASSS